MFGLKIKLWGKPHTPPSLILPQGRKHIFLFRRKSRVKAHVISSFIAFLSLFFSCQISAQNPLRLNFSFLNNGESLLLNHTVTDLSGTSYKATDIAFYISDLQIKHDGGQVLDFGDSVFYVNIRASIFELGMQDVDHVESLAFNVGIPANINHSDISAYPEDHPMYFQTPPMHWGWSAGYTFFLIDGMADSNGDNVPDVGFELHCLGDENLQFVETVNTATIQSDGTREIFQQVNIDQWLRNIDLKTLSAQHGNTGINADAMDNVQNYPVFTAPLNASVNEITDFTGAVRFDNTGNKLNITWEAMNHIGKLELYNAEGKLIASVPQSAVQGTHSFAELASGAYLLRILSENGHLLNRLNVVQP